MPNFRSGGRAGNAGVYLKKLQYEQPYSIMSNPDNRYVYQDALIASSIKNQYVGSQRLRSAANLEAATMSRFGIVYRQFMNLLTGFPEYLK
jgi:hypothetical protein